MNSLNTEEGEKVLTKKFAVVKWEGMAEIGEGESVPMSAKLHPNEFMILQAIALFQMEGGYCNSTVAQISDTLPLSRATVFRYMKSLLEFEYEGKKVVTMEKRAILGKQRNVYRLLPNRLFGIYGESFSLNLRPQEDSLSLNLRPSKERKDTKELNKKEEDEQMKNKEVIKVFTDKYKEVYMTEYKIVWSRDNKFVSKFLKTVESMEDSEIKQLVEIIVSHYDKWTSNSAKYPLSFNTLSLGWIQEKAKQIIEDEKRAESQVEEVIVEATKTTQKSISSIMERIKKKKGGQ